MASEELGQESDKAPDPLSNNGGIRNLWQDLAYSASKAMMIYCGLSFGTLCILTWLVLSGSLHGTTETDSSDASLPENGENGSHYHDAKFYLFVINLLAGIRIILLCMAKALRRPTLQKEAGTIGSWLIGSLCIIISELIFGLSLYKCLPGAHILILLFLLVEILVQLAVTWIVWNFKLQLALSSDDK